MIPTLVKSPVVFDHEHHRYFLGDKELKGVTSTLIKTAYPDTYKVPEGMSEEKWMEVLAEAARKGSALHTNIETYENFGTEDTEEVSWYVKAKEEHGLIHLASEYLVSDEESYASMIDHVFTNEQDDIILVDIKRTSKLHEDNVRLQLSIYKRFFEKQNPTLRVSKIAVMWFNSGKVTYKEFKPWSDEELDNLFFADMIGTHYNAPAETQETLPSEFVDVQRQLANIELKMREYKKFQEAYKSQLLLLMEEHGIKKFKGDVISLTYVASTTRENFNTKAFKEEYPDLYNLYKTTSEVKSSIKITIHGK